MRMAVVMDVWTEVKLIKKPSYYKSGGSDYERVGKCAVDSDGVILELKWQHFRQGYVFKDYYAFHNEPENPCYVPELSETVYTAKDFFHMCNGQKEFAEELFYKVDWQHPESQMEDWFVNGEWDVCGSCQRIFNSYGETKCPHCGTECGKKN